VEKIILKPTVKEFLYKNKEENTYFDVYSYEGSTNQEKNLGILLVIGQIKYSGEDLSYLVSLASSLAKREYYSEKSLQGQNPKEAFGRSLKKLNEVLEEFFQNKDFKLNLGLIAIASENIYISRLGKFKVSLARNGQFIDILNNVELFRKDTEGEKQFSNIISGKLQAGDKLFAFSPTRSITLREKQLNEIFIKENQEEFGQKIAQLAANVKSFSCCGAHINMLQIKEIPFQTRPKYQTFPSSPQARVFQTGAGEGLENQLDSPVQSAVSQNNIEGITRVGTEKTQPSGVQTEQPHIIPAEFSVTKRGNIVRRAVAKLEKFRLLSRINDKTFIRIFFSSILITAVGLTLLFSLRNAAGLKTKSALTSAAENLELAQSRLSQNDLRGARSLLQAALLEISGLPDKKGEKIKNEINKTLTSLDRLSTKKPVLFLDAGQQLKNDFLILLTSFNDNLNIVASSGALFSATSANLTEIEKLKLSPKFLFSSQTGVAAFDGWEKLAVFNLKTKNMAFYTLKNPVSASDAALYENNLYILSENRIYKYLDALSGGVKQNEWLNDSSSGRLTAIAVDGNVFALNDEGKLIKYFKGKKLTEFDLQLSPSADSRIFTTKDSAFLYLADRINKKVYVFDKSSGELKASYDISSAGQVQDIAINQAGAVWILSTDNKVWQIQP
jgi:hypothetical protein